MVMVKSLLVVSTFPPQSSTYAHTRSAVASYTKNTLDWIKVYAPHMTITVLADVLKDSPEDEVQGGVKVLRCWRENSLASISSILKIAWQAKQSQTILFPFEWTMFGSKRYFAAWGPILLLCLRLMGKHVIFVSHGVVLDAKAVAGQLGASSNSLKINILNMVLHAYYWMVMSLSDKTVVFEQNLKAQLIEKFGFQKNIVVIPHGVDRQGMIAKNKKASGEHANNRIAMQFGFLIWYKGTDKVVGLMEKLLDVDPQTKWRLVLAGGESKHYRKDPVYKAYVGKLYQQAKKSNGKISITGFVAHGDIAKYLQQADLMLFGYRAFVSSSGPLSLAFSSGTPVLLDKILMPYQETHDFKTAMEQAQLSTQELFCLSDNANLKALLDRFDQDASYRKRLTQFSTLMGDARSWEKIGKLYAQLFEK
jgi:glycosyltransferase involved in cell wall biosynthesis